MKYRLILRNFAAKKISRASMKLILLTMPYFFIEEHQILTALFDEGLELLHLRKPNAEPVYSERLLSLIPEQYRKKIVVHEHFYLKSEYNLAGIHLNKRNPVPPRNYKGQISRSCHSAEEIVEYKKSSDYLFLSPIFDSISKENYFSQFDDEKLKQLAKQKVIDKKVMALGGINIERIAQAKNYGFGGVVVQGDFWQHFNRHQTSDFKELINHFRKLRKAAD